MSSEVLKFLRSGVWAKFVLQFLFPPPTENLVETAPQTNGKKGEVSFGCLSLYKSENRFPQWLLPCLVRLDSTPIQALCSSSISAQFQTLCPFKISISLKLPVENSDSRRIESKTLPPTQLSSSS